MATTCFAIPRARWCAAWPCRLGRLWVGGLESPNGRTMAIEVWKMVWKPEWFDVWKMRFPEKKPQFDWKEKVEHCGWKLELFNKLRALRSLLVSGMIWNDFRPP